MSMLQPGVNSKPLRGQTVLLSAAPGEGGGGRGGGAPTGAGGKESLTDLSVLIYKA